MENGLERRSLADQIKDALIAQICDGTLKPGDRLVELKIAKDMQTSQAPVREAMRELEALSLIEMRRNRGSIVRSISAEELRDIYAVRAELEGHAVEIAATQAPEIGQEMDVLCARMERAIRSDDRSQFVELNDAFHQKIVEASGNQVLTDIWRKLDIRARSQVNVTRRARPLEETIQEHRDIAAFVRNGDPARARQALTRHIMAVLGSDE